VPYKGGAPAMADLLGGQLMSIFSAPPTAFPFIKAGKIRALATYGNSRTKVLAEIPTLKELGYDVEFYIWVSLFTQKGTSIDVVNKLRASVKQAIDEPIFINAMSNMSAPIFYQDAPELQTAIDIESKHFTNVVRRIGKIE
jgi:tripartite-type tricarboxylate transporter receptor subunit TctC